VGVTYLLRFGKIQFLTGGNGADGMFVD
jgi:hypothetical protein